VPQCAFNATPQESLPVVAQPLLDCARRLWQRVYMAAVIMGGFFFWGGREMVIMTLRIGI
jgi:hypothetical protein